MEFRVNFGAEDEARLTPCEDDKPKGAETTLFQAGSDYLLSARTNKSFRPMSEALAECRQFIQPLKSDCIPFEKPFTLVNMFWLSTLISK